MSGSSRSIAWMILVAVVLFAAGCEDSGNSRADLRDQQQLLDQNAARWRDANLSTYQYVYERSCFCVPHDHLVIFVVNKQVSEAFRIPSGTYLTPQELATVRSVDGLFALAQDAINRRVASLSVTYHPQYGYPELIRIDNTADAVDDEVSYVARNLQ